jgi:hypothetical protein
MKVDEAATTGRVLQTSNNLCVHRLKYSSCFVIDEAKDERNMPNY